MLSFPCFCKYFERYLDVRTYTIVFPRKIVVPWAITFLRVIASPSLLVKKKMIQSTPSSYTHSHSHCTWFSLLKKTHSCHCWLRHLEGDAKVESDPGWLIYEDFESSQRNQIEREQSSFVPQGAKTKQTKKWDCGSRSKFASFRMYIFSSLDVTFSWGSLSHEERLCTRKILSIGHLLNKRPA